MKTFMFGLLAVLHPCFANAQPLQNLPAPLNDSDYFPVEQAEAELGQLLFYDRILSGNKTIACATCHHPEFGTSDGLALSFGDGGVGLGPARRLDPSNMPEKRIPRNSPALFNLGSREVVRLFHDGRLEFDPAKPNGIRTPMGGDMAEGFASLLSAQTMFPVLSRDEMAGSFRENEVAQLVRQGRITGQGGAWDVLAERVRDVPAYVQKFKAVYPEVTKPGDIGFTKISDAVAAFMEFEWRSDTSLFDAVLRGQAKFEGLAAPGAELFYGEANCAQCHSGPLLTDQGFHAMAAPQIGPGKSATFETHHRDDGRFRVTGDEAVRYAFRTPSLRNVALTAPYGHAGAHRDLAAFIADHADPVAALPHFDRTQAVLPSYDAPDFTILDDAEQVAAISAAVKVAPVSLSGREITAIVAFLNTLTDPISVTGRLGIPDAVPSGLEVPRQEAQ